MPARNTIEIAVTATDLASKVLDNIGGSVKNLGSTLTNIGGSLTALGAPILALGFKAFTAFDEMDDAADQLDAVLKSTAGAAGMTRQEILRMGTALQSASTFTRAAIVSGENLLLTFTNIGKTTFPRATQALVDMATAMGTDVKSQAIQLGKALNDPIEGISALTRVGVTFTDQQKEMIKQMVEMGDVAGAQGVILAELEKEFGGSAAAQVDTMSKISNAVNDLFIDLGVVIQPVIDAVGNFLLPILESLSQSLTAMSDSGDNTIGVIIALGAGLAILGPVIAAVGFAITLLVGMLSGPLLPIALIIAAVIALADHFNISMQQVQLYLSLAVLYAQYYIQGIVTEIERVVTNIKTWVDAHPQLMTALLLIGGLIIGLAVIVAGLNIALGIATFLFGILLSPIVLLTLAVVGLLIALDSLYPGGLSGLLRDAGTSAQQLGYILQYALGQAVNWVQNRLAEFQVTLHNAALSFLDFAKSIVNNPFLQQIIPGLKTTADLFNQIYEGQKKLLGASYFNPITSSAPIPFIPPAPPNIAPSGPSGAPGFLDNIKDLLGGGQGGKGITINFAGTGGPTNPAEADESGFMVVNALRAHGLEIP